jgi:hypothetical protein
LGLSHDVTISPRRFRSTDVNSEVSSTDGTLGITATFVICPNEECQRTTAVVRLYRWDWQTQGAANVRVPLETLGRWQLKPWGKARVFPDYVPEPSRADYTEACAIVELSPKAAATLARRAVQGIIRGFWGVVKPRLKDEIDEVEEKVGHGVEPETFETLHAIRELGNIGAHPERDINLIVDVEPGEAELLLQAIETLIEDTYIARQKRAEHRAAVEELRRKKSQRRQPP